MGIVHSVGKSCDECACPHGEYRDGYGCPGCNGGDQFVMKELPPLGTRVRVSAWYKRRKGQGQREWERQEGFVFGPLRHPSKDAPWAQERSDTREGLYIGWRTLSDGRFCSPTVSYSFDPTEYDGPEYIPSRVFKAALVVFSEREKPVLVPLDALEVVTDDQDMDDAGWD